MPLIAWSIKAAQTSNCFSQILVSTDDNEIAEVARSFGADVPFVRPNDLSGDTVGTHPVMAHALEWMQSKGINCDNLCCLYATAPFVRAEDLRIAERQLESSRSGIYVFAATSFPSSIQRAIKIGKDGYSSMFEPKCYTSRSQDLQEAYHDAGQFYWAATSTWSNVANIFESARPLILPRWRVQDIDTEEDWHRAELMHQLLENIIYDH
tara:strand:+ start:8491 stop:9117 length:627 start_codon:yes stop_codon:yes gene_type:complete